MSSDARHREGAALVQLGGGFFRPESRPSRDLGVLLCRCLPAAGPGPSVLDLMAGCGIRSLRYGLEGGASRVWANDADPDRLPVMRANLAPLGQRLAGLRCTAATAEKLLAGCLVREQRFQLLDLDAFGCPTALVPLALEAVALEGVLYLASTDGRSATGHDRRAALRSLGAAARAHPASWELALRLQLGQVARAAWALGRGIRPLFSFSEGRTFRSAIQLRRRPAPGEEAQLGLLAHCHGCGDQQEQSLLGLRRWAGCRCGDGAALSVSGPLWLGPLQDPGWLARMDTAAEALPAASVDPATRRWLQRLAADPGVTARCWPSAEIARRLGGGPPPLRPLLEALRAEGWLAEASGLMPGQLRSTAPWPRILALAEEQRATR